MAPKKSVSPPSTSLFGSKVVVTPSEPKVSTTWIIIRVVSLIAVVVSALSLFGHGLWGILYGVIAVVSLLLFLATFLPKEILDQYFYE